MRRGAYHIGYQLFIKREKIDWIMKNLVYTILAIAFFISIVGCDKDTDEFIKTDETKDVKPGAATVIDTIWQEESTALTRPTDLAKLFPIEKINDQLEKPVSKDSIIAENGGKIVTPDMTIEFPANCCVGRNGICKGKLDIEYLLLRTKGELIGSDKPTISDGKLLISGGVVYIVAKQNGELVRINANKNVTIKYKMRPTETGMSFFEGRGIDRFKFNWVQINSGTLGNGIPVWRDSMEQPIGYQIITDRFGWINCDKFYGENNLTDKIALSLPDSFTNTNTGAFLIFKDILSVVKLEGNPVTKQFSIPKNYKGVPIGKQVTVVTFSNIKDRTYFDVQDLTIAQTNALRMRPLPVDLLEIKKKIQGF